MASDVDGQNRADVDPVLGAPDPILISGELVGSAQLSIYLLTGPPRWYESADQNHLRTNRTWGPEPLLLS